MPDPVVDSPTLSQAEGDVAAEKCYPAGGDYVYVANARSWGEVDDLLEAQTAERQARVVTQQFSGLVSNILWAGELSADQKASLLTAAANSLPARLNGPDVSDEVKAVKDAGGGLWGRLLDKVKAEPKQDAGTFRVFKDLAGDMRWLAVYSNSARDRHGELISRKAHAEYQEFAEKQGDYPELWLWHVPGSRIGKTDWMDLSTEGFALASGTIDAGKEIVAERLAADPDLGVSFGFRHRRKDKTEDGVIERYRAFEISPLPAKVAANPLTAFATQEELAMLTPAKKEFLTSKLGAQEAELIERTLSLVRAKSDEAGIEFKEALDSIVEHVAANADSNAGEPDASATADTNAGGEPDGGAGTGEPDAAAALEQAFAKAFEPFATVLKEIAETVQAQGQMLEELQSKDISLGSAIAKAMDPRSRGAYIASQARAAAGNDSLVAGAKEAGLVKGAADFQADGANDPPHLRDQNAMLRAITGAMPVQVLRSDMQNGNQGGQ